MRKSVRFSVSLLVVALMLLVAAAPALACNTSSTDPCPPEPCKCECRTPGFWKNHPEAWPVSSIMIGGVTYTKDQAIAGLTQQAGDKSYTLFRALVAAKLNVLSGCPSGKVTPVINAADAWMCDNPLGSCVRGSSAAWKCGEPLYMILDYYNNNCFD